MTFKTLVLGAATAASTPFLTPVARVSGNEQVIDDFAVEAPASVTWRAGRRGSVHATAWSISRRPHSQSLATYVRGNLHSWSRRGEPGASIPAINAIAANRSSFGA
jgi:hypothetical protein